MRNFRFVWLPAFLLGTFAASAQDIREAYNFSNLTVQGTARSMGFGNALGSVGGDFSSVSVNPAGLGVYRSSEFSFTPSLRINAAGSDYLGTTTNDNNTHANINSFGLVFTSAPKGKRYDESNWKAVSFAFGMNRVADFNQNYTYQGENRTSSASLAFESDANLNPQSVNGTTDQYGNYQPSNTLGYLGYNSYLLNKNTAGNYYSIVPSGGVNQLKSVQTNGGIDEYTFSLGGNYKEKLMLGITIGIPVINYNSMSSYSETLAADNGTTNPSNFSSFNYNQQLSINGTGVNAKIGAIYKISDNFRVGAAFHTPTYYSISDVSTPSISVHSDSSATLSVDNGYTVQNRFDYNLTTPWKGILSATFILKKLGFITADYEYVDYSTMRYNYGNGYDYNSGLSYQQEGDAMNQAIKNTYQAASNFRLGAEIKLSSYFMIRAGGGYYGNPYKSSSDYNAQRIDINGGIGFHFHHFFTDLGYVHSMYKTEQQPYSIDYSGVVSTATQAAIPTAKINYNLNNLALTVGVKF